MKHVINTFELACMNTELIEIITLLPHLLLHFNVDSNDKGGRYVVGTACFNVALTPCLSTRAACIKSFIFQVIGSHLNQQKLTLG